MTAKKTSPENEQELVAELRHLRTVARDVAENFILRCEADIETILSGLARLPRGTMRRKNGEWEKLVKGLKLKPGKGRLKDLKDLHNVVGKLLADVLEESERRQPKKKAPRVPVSKEPTPIAVLVEPAVAASHYSSPEIA